MSADPFFSVVVATYNRGKAILPTLRSALAQEEKDFEVLVVGDGCTDDTGEIVQNFGSDKIRWQNLPVNGKSQSFANNAGIAAARGKWIAYLGHDDIWSPDHLAQIRKTIEADPALEFVASGCLYYGPEDIGPTLVTGFLDETHTAGEYFIPPSSMAHRRDAVQRFGLWRAPEALISPVDSDFVLRAAGAGLKFGATGKVTVHKFAAGDRYLSYLTQTDDEQLKLAGMSDDELARRSEEFVARAKRTGRFMSFTHRRREPGEVFRAGRDNKGLSRPVLVPLGSGKTIEQAGDPRALDWYVLEEGPPKFRVSGPNPRPKILIPFTGGSVEISCEIVRMPEHAEGKSLEIYVGGERRPSHFRKDAEGRTWLRFFARLAPDDYTVVSLLIPAPEAGRPENFDWYRYGVGIASVRIAPVSGLGKVWRYLANRMNW